MGDNPPVPIVSGSSSPWTSPVVGSSGPASATPVTTPSPAPAMDSFGGVGPLGAGLAATASASAAAGGGAGVAAAALTWTPAAYSLPPQVGLGVATIHRYDDTRVTPSTIAITVFTPLGGPEFAGVVLDMNAKKHAEILPDRCIVGDAGLTRAFLGIDKREGTPLDQRLDQIVAGMPKQADGSIDPEAAIQFVRVKVSQLLAWTAGSSFNDGRAEFAWDKAISVAPSAWDTFKGAAFEPVGHAPHTTGQQFPVVPLEKYLDAGQGYCIQKALLASLLLERCGVPHRLVNGAVSQGPGKSVGHTWIELADGRVLDAAWKQVAQPDTAGAPVPGFFRFGGSWRFENQTFPYLRD